MSQPTARVSSINSAKIHTPTPALFDIFIFGLVHISARTQTKTIARRGMNGPKRRVTITESVDFNALHPAELSDRLVPFTHLASKIIAAMLLQTIESRLRKLPLHCVQAICVVSPGAPVDILKAFMYRPDSFGKPFCALAHTLMRGRSDWSEGDREALGAFVSDLNRCNHCATAHCEVASLIVGRAKMRDVLENNTDPGCQTKLHAFRDFAAKVTLSPESVKSDDAVPLRTANLTDNAIVDGMLIVAGFNLINRVASALHFKIPSSSKCFRVLGSCAYLDTDFYAASRSGLRDPVKRSRSRIIMGQPVETEQPWLILRGRGSQR
jgi:uncharacterized peroxidase-related enzyme